MFKNVDFRTVAARGNKDQDYYKGRCVGPGMTFAVETVVFVGDVMLGLVANI